MPNSGPPQIFSASRRAARLHRHVKAVSREDFENASAQFIRNDIADDLAERLSFMQREPSEALIIGDPAGIVSGGLKSIGYSTHQATLADLDEEKPYGITVPLILSVCSLDTVNDLPGSLLHVRNALTDDGLFLASFTGFGSLPKLRQILLQADGDTPAARLHPQIDTQAASALMQRAGFTRQVVDSRSINVAYRSFDRLLSDLRAQGLTNVLTDAPPAFTRSGRVRAERAFDDARDDHGRVVETFEIITVTGWNGGRRGL